MLKPEVWNNVFTPPWRAIRLLLFALVIMLIASGVGELKRTKGQTSSPCSPSYRETTFWNVGFQGEVTVVNNGPAINGWTVTFMFPTTTQTIYELWHGTFTQSGQTVTVRNASYNANIPTGGSIVFGFNANWSGSHPAPTGFTLNGQSCGGGGGGPTIQTSVTTLNVNEGGSAQFGVRLSAAPPGGTATVNVARLSGDADLTVSGGSTLTFTSANFGTFQNVTISAAEDADTANGSAIFRVSSTGIPNVDVTANEVENDSVAIQTSVTTLAVNEGASAQYGVRLSAAPPGGTATVNVARLSGDADLTVSGGATLTFTSANFGTFQNVTISAAEDADTASGSAVFRASGTNLTPADVTANEVDNDMVAILTSVTTLPVNEGGSAQYGVRLSAAPPGGTAMVNVARISGDTDLTVSGGATLTFTSANFGTFQNVTISAAEDGDMANGSAVFRASGTNLTPADVTAMEVENDVPIAIQTNLVRTLAVVENDAAQVGLRLASPPPAPVTVTATRQSGDTNLNVNLPGTVTFTPTDFQTFKFITIRADEDADITNGTAMFQFSGPGLLNAAADVSEFDNDGAPVAQRTFVALLNGANEVPPVTTSATGTSVVILSPDETAALVSLNFTGLSSPQTAAHLHGPAAPGNNAPGTILDLDQPLGQVSNLLWNIQPVGGLSVLQLVNALKGGQIYANVHTANFPSGEVRGWLFPVAIDEEDPPPPPPGGFANAARFLEQATFGPTVAEVERVRTIGFEAWLNEQFAMATTGYNNLVQLQQGQFVSYPVKLQFFRNAMTAPDQLRQRVAWALSQIVVAADIGNQDGTGNPTAMVSQYHDILLRNAFGNYRTLLREMSVSPIMGTYLTLVNSQRANTATGAQPDENYIRELWQLFTIGTFRLNPNGTVMLDGQGRPIETYTIAEIQEGARALTGWNYAPAAGQPNQGNNNPLNPFAPMITNAANHDTGAKTLLTYPNQVSTMVPANQTVVQDLDSVIDNVFNHPNVGPFIGRQLIQHLVTSNPSPSYVGRITAVFNNNGQGVRGDLRAVVRAILLDAEARGDSKTDPAYGKLREPALFFTHLFRGLGATGGMWGIPQRSRSMAQDIFSPPSVFNYYQPDFRVVANGQSIFAPPAQLLTTSTIIGRLNTLNDFLFGTIQPGGDPNPVGSPNNSVTLNFAPFDQLAPNPAALVDELNTRLMYGSMSPQMRQTVIDAVTRISNNNRLRVQTAIYAIAASMQYQVQR